MKLSLSMLPSDWLIYTLLIISLLALWRCRKVVYLKEVWQRLGQNRIGMVAASVLVVFTVTALLDSIHFQMQSKAKNTVIQTVSLLDLSLKGLNNRHEKTYSAPFASHEYTRSMIKNAQGQEVMGYAALRYSKATQQKTRIVMAILQAIAIGMVTLAVLLSLASLSLRHKGKSTFQQQLISILQGKTTFAWREMIITLSIITILITATSLLIQDFHILGTNKVGGDIFYQSIKSIRTAVLIGTITTALMLPLALLLGLLAGFFGGWVDDIIQYLYTTLSSIPGVLLISATILVMQVYISAHPLLFPSLAARADARLLALCAILGITSWSNLCRLLRAETLKLRELEFVQAARVLGVKPLRILFRHILPNVMHIVLITLILDFSGLVLAEAVLSYVGVGVDPTMASWGNMINASRLELAREPAVWWPLLSAMTFMLTLVLCANLFSDAVSEALNPRSRHV